MLRVAVKLPVGSGRIGDYVADATALDAAGADSIWLDSSHATSTEPWIFLGALAAVTHRARLGVMVGFGTGLPEAVDILGRMSSGRVVVGVPARRETKPLVEQLRRPGSAPNSPSVLLICKTSRDAEGSVHVADGIILPGGEDEVGALRAKHSGDFEVWIDAQIPADRAGWANMLAALEAAGATGIIVPWDPRIVDLLRNAGEEDDRTDLLIATG